MSRLSAYISGVFLGLFVPLVSYSQVIVDPSSPGTAFIDGGNAYMDIIDIATPTDGISHNKFTEFNVDPNGLILNNSADDVLVETHFYSTNVTGNSNLVSGPASIILNEVTGSSSSLLRGLVDVAGPSASVIISNPNGITCNGCAFSNSPSTTLTTGSSFSYTNTGSVTGAPGMSGRLDYDVTGGRITIEQNGMGSSGTIGLTARHIDILGNIENGAYWRHEYHNAALIDNVYIGGGFHNYRKYIRRITAAGVSPRVADARYEFHYDRDTPLDYFALRSPIDSSLITSLPVDASPNDIYMANYGDPRFQNNSLRIRSDSTYIHSANPGRDVSLLGMIHSIDHTSIVSNGHLRYHNLKVGGYGTTDGSINIRNLHGPVTQTGSVTIDGSESGSGVTINSDSFTLDSDADITTESGDVRITVANSLIIRGEISSAGDVLLDTGISGTLKRHTGSSITYAGVLEINNKRPADINTEHPYVDGAPSNPNIPHVISIVPPIVITDSGPVPLTSYSVNSAGPATFSWTIIFSEPVTYVDVSDFYVFADGERVFTTYLAVDVVGQDVAATDVPSAQSSQYTVTVTVPSIQNHVGKELTIGFTSSGRGIRDLDENLLDANLSGINPDNGIDIIDARPVSPTTPDDTDDPVIPDDTTDPFVRSISSLGISSGSSTLRWRVTFSEAVSGIDGSGSNFGLRTSDGNTISATPSVVRVDDSAAAASSSYTYEVSFTLSDLSAYEGKTILLSVGGVGATITDTSDNANSLVPYTANGNGILIPVTPVTPPPTTSDGRIIDIVSPIEANGISHNVFEEFTVTETGRIFNNSLRDGTSSALPGGSISVSANPNLTREASLIIAEVTGSDISTLDGVLEIFGGSADLVITNPNGVTCYGCSFVNANEVTLATGSVRNVSRTSRLFNLDISSGLAKVHGRHRHVRHAGDFTLLGRQVTVGYGGSLTTSKGTLALTTETPLGVSDPIPLNSSYAPYSLSVFGGAQHTSWNDGVWDSEIWSNSNELSDTSSDYSIRMYGAAAGDIRVHSYEPTKKISMSHSIKSVGDVSILSVGDVNWGSIHTGIPDTDYIGNFSVGKHPRSDAVFGVWGGYVRTTGTALIDVLGDVGLTGLPRYTRRLTIHSDLGIQIKGRSFHSGLHDRTLETFDEGADIDIELYGGDLNIGNSNRPASFYSADEINFRLGGTGSINMSGGRLYADGAIDMSLLGDVNIDARSTLISRYDDIFIYGTGDSALTSYAGDVEIYGDVFAYYDGFGRDYYGREGSDVLIRARSATIGADAWVTSWSDDVRIKVENDLNILGTVLIEADDDLELVSHHGSITIGDGIPRESQNHPWSGPFISSLDDIFVRSFGDISLAPYGFIGTYDNLRPEFNSVILDSSSGSVNIWWEDETTAGGVFAIDDLTPTLSYDTDFDSTEDLGDFVSLSTQDFIEIYAADSISIGDTVIEADLGISLKSYADSSDESIRFGERARLAVWDVPEIENKAYIEIRGNEISNSYIPFLDSVPDSTPAPTTTPTTVPYLDIARATGTGLVSLNSVATFNVDSDGFILNNSTTGGTVPTLGGHLDANSNLNGTSASTIVVEVSSVSPSSLTGLIEIFGESAGFVLANPNGIYCDSCVFVNTDDVSLTTGSAFVTNTGAIEISVAGGMVTVADGGLTSDSSAHLLGRNVWVSGAISTAPSSTISLLGGAQTSTLKSDNWTVRSYVSSANSAPLVSNFLPQAVLVTDSAVLEGYNLVARSTESSQAIDILGSGEFGGEINITSSGDVTVGSLLSTLTASDEIEIEADGSVVTLNGSLEGEHVGIESLGLWVNPTGTLSTSSGDIRVETEGLTMIMGNVTSLGNVDIIAGTESEGGTGIFSFMLTPGSVVSGKDINVDSTGSAIISGMLSATDDIDFRVDDGDLTIESLGSVRSSGDDINIRVDDSTNIHGILSAYDRLKIRSGTLEVFGGGLVESVTDDVRIRTNGAIIVSGDIFGDDIKLRSRRSTLTVNSGGNIVASDDLKIRTSGSIIINGDVTAQDSGSLRVGGRNLVIDGMLDIGGRDRVRVRGGDTTGVGTIGLASYSTN